MADPGDPLPPVTARRLRLFPPALALHCTDPARHELVCTHPPETPMITWRAGDGCTGRMCQSCDAQYGVKRWPGLAERIAGPPGGLDALDALRALRDGPRS